MQSLPQSRAASASAFFAWTPGIHDVKCDILFLIGKIEFGFAVPRERLFANFGNGQRARASNVCFVLRDAVENLAAQGRVGCAGTLLQEI
jgi:hypothetical protein